ncbi:MAG TPA: isoprenylcysteine carboxylmethyltransferase family protein, partial [Leptospiraceae bacterium]|nr:isoprenylcysteine carboxylmethyltransferase family protein [Leptospiraceae bacterium]
LFVTMSLMLFLPAWTTDYLLAWIYLSIFFSGIFFITIYIFIFDPKLLESRLKVGPVSEQRPIQKAIQSFASIGFLSVYIISSFDYRFHWSNVPSLVSYLANGILAFTMYLFFLVFKINSFLSATVEIQENQKLITDGVYSIVRHPMYFAASLLFLTTPIALGSYYGLFSLPFMLLVLMYRSIDEEKMLIKQFPEYIEYSKKVKKRILPYIW